jgi:hypothetical protein
MISVVRLRPRRWLEVQMTVTRVVNFFDPNSFLIIARVAAFGWVALGFGRVDFGIMLICLL